MNASFPSALIYLFGFIGLVSIGLLPLRSWQVLRRLRDETLQTQGGVLAVFALLVIAAALWSDFQITARIFRCLTQAYCGPGVASGWIYLAMLGVVYMAFEAVIFVLLRVGRVKTAKPSV